VAGVRKSHPRFVRIGGAPRVELTGDDVDILRRILRHRFLRADDLYRLFPDRSPDRLSRRLMRLYRNGFLDRPIAQVDRYRSGGSQAMVYGLDTAGARFLSETFGAAVGSGDWKSRNRSYTRENLEHTLAVAGFLVDLELACRARDELALIPFEEIVAAISDGPGRATTAGRWPVPVSWHGHSGSVQIAPDAIVGLRASLPDGRTRRSFLFAEIDRGTMTIVPARQVREREAFLYRATILRKLLTYAESYRQGLHKEHLGIPTARVLFLTTNEGRALAMQQAAQRFIAGEGKVPAGLFLFGSLRPGQNPFESTYTDAGGQPVMLAPSG
jgi:hypothetical protein